MQVLAYSVLVLENPHLKYDIHFSKNQQGFLVNAFAFNVH